MLVNTDLDQILVRLASVPLTLSSCPPGLPVLHPVLLSSGHPEHILLPIRLERGSSWDLSYELDIGETSIQFLDNIVTNTMRPAKMGKWFVLNCY